MPSSTFYPYKYAAEALEIDAVALDINGVTGAGNEFINKDHHTVLLTSFEDDWATINLTVRVTDPNQQINEALADGVDVSNVSVWLIARNKTTRVRTAAQLQFVDEGWGGQLSLKKDDIARTTELECFATLSCDLEPAAGYAYKFHEKIADATPWKLYTDIVPAMPGGALNSEWVDFETSTNDALNKRKDCVWYLDLSDSESPRLLLNEAVPKLRQTLEVESKTSKSARVRDALIHSILQGVISELATFTLSKAAGAALEDQLDWQQKLLISLARKSDGGSEEIVATGWITSWDTGEDVGQVLTEVTTAIQRHLNLRHSSEHLSKSVEQEVSND